MKASIKFWSVKFSSWYLYHAKFLLSVIRVSLLQRICQIWIYKICVNCWCVTWNLAQPKLPVYIYVRDTWVAMSCAPTGAEEAAFQWSGHCRGVWEHAPPENLRCSEVNSRAFWAEKNTDKPVPSLVRILYILRQSELLRLLSVHSYMYMYMHSALVQVDISSCRRKKWSDHIAWPAWPGAPPLTNAQSCQATSPTGNKSTINILDTRCQKHHRHQWAQHLGFSDEEAQ